MEYCIGIYKEREREVDLQVHVRHRGKCCLFNSKGGRMHGKRKGYVNLNFV